MLLDVAVKVDGVTFGERYDGLLVGRGAASDYTSFGVAAPLFGGSDESVDLDNLDVVELLYGSLDEGFVGGLGYDEAVAVAHLLSDLGHLLSDQGLDDDSEGVGLRVAETYVLFNISSSHLFWSLIVVGLELLEGTLEDDEGLSLEDTICVDVASGDELGLLEVA